MKKNIHPQLYDVTVTCSCGSSFKTCSAVKEINPTLCSSCHPFFSGQEKYVDTAGRIDKFKKRYSK
ncbi:50S ribosomal protein L31 [Candidatus Dependentiae bacterium]|nr:50S ribosomal protein L31 [Candidatus Dependentiae bacterium]